MKYFFLILTAIFFSETLRAQKTATADLWSGEYAVYPTDDLPVKLQEI